MIKFIVVDDDEKEVNHICDLLDQIVKDNKVISTYKGCNSQLSEEINNLDYRKVYILDIEIEGKISGINLAKHIREVDYESEIIFITNHDKMFESAHRSVYEIFDFIEKFHNFDKRFKKDISEIIKRNFDNKMFHYMSSTNIELSIYYKSILYIYREKEERKLIIVTDSNKFIVNMTLKEISLLLDDRFRQCFRSCIVNYLRVVEKNYKDKYFILDNGEKVYMLSKAYKKELEYD